MTRHLIKAATALSCFIATAWTASAADGVWTNTASGNWDDPAKWVDGIVAGEGGTATFKANTGSFFITNNLPAPVVLSALSGNTDPGNGATWAIVGGTNELVAPALITTHAHSLSVRPTTLSGDTDITITGLGRFFLGDDNLYTGRTIVSNGNVRVARDSGFGPVPSNFRPDAIILDWGGIENDDNNFVLTNHPNRGITVTARGGFIGCGYTAAGFQIDAPITGPGILGINFENCPVILNNPANDYSGGTVVGTNGPGANPLTTVFRLGQNEVLPHGIGKGGLRIVPDGSFNNTLPTTTLDLNGKTETVNTLHSGARAVITSSVAGAGRLIVGGLDEDSDYRGALTGGAVIEKQGSGTLSAIGARLSSGKIDLKAGTLHIGGPNIESGATVLFNGGNMTLSQPSGLYEFTGSSGASVNLDATLSYTGWRLWPEKGSATTSTDFPNNTQYVYRGRWHLPEAGIYSFAKGFDDGGYLMIDGQVLLNNGTTGTRAVTNNIALNAGWHTVELRFSQGAGGVGPQFGFRNGILYDAGNGGFTNAAELARARIFTDDGGPDLLADGPSNILYGRLALAADGTLDVPQAAGALVLAGGVTTNIVSDPEPVLTVNLPDNAPLPFGSPTATPALLDAAINTAGGLVLTNRVWLRRLPSAPYTIASGADLALDAPALLGDTALTLDSYSVRIVRDDSVGGDGTVTANAGTAVWFDTTRATNTGFSNDAATTFAPANDVTLNGGTARFTGNGTITYGGTLTGTGTVIKDGAGALLLSDTGSSLSGEIRIDAGRLIPADEAALGGATVRLNGGRLVNPAGLDLTLDTTPFITQSGGFEVTGANETMTVNGVLTGTGGISKWGAGKLVLGGTAHNENLVFHLREGTLDLAKSGDAASHAVRDLPVIESNTVVRLTGSNGNQIGGNVTLTGGILDLNGLSEAIGVLTNTAAGGTVTNSGAQAATLTVGEGGASSAFSGYLRDGTASLSLAKTGAGTFVLPMSALKYTGGTAVSGGTLRLTHPLPAPGKLAYRLDATDTAKLTLLDGTNVAAWADSTTNGVNFSQGTAAQQPIYVTNAINGRPAIRFGYAGSRRLIASKSASARTVFIVTRVVSQQSLAGIWGQSGQDRGIRQNNTTSWRHTGNGADGNDFSFNGEMYIDGTAGFSFASNPLHLLTAVSTAAQNWVNAVGDYWGNTTHNRYYKGDIGEILVYHSLLTPEERKDVEAYLKAKWFGGLTLPPSQPVSVAQGAQLAVQNMDITLGALSGGGKLASEEGSVVTLADYASFTGTVSGAGTVALGGTSGADGRFLPQDLGVTVRNNGTLPAALSVEGEGYRLFVGAVRDGSNTLGITHASIGTTYFAGTNSAYTGETRIESGTAIIGGVAFAKYVRFYPQAMRTDGAYPNSGYQLSEFHLMLGGAKLSYPEGTLATCPGAGAGVEGPEKAIDGSVDTKFYINSMTPIHPLIIQLPAAAAFDGYRWYTANDATGRDPIVWTVDVSNDGVNWTAIDIQNYSADQNAITTSRKTLVGTWSLNSIAEMNVFSDLSATTVSGTLGVSATRETVGALSGDGALRLVNAGTLGINAFQNAAFSGGITGTGTVVKSGAATQTLSGALAFSGTLIVEDGTLDLDGATLTGVTNITLRAGGTLTGAATVGNDLTVTFEGGTCSGSLAVAGALTVTGDVAFSLPAGVTYPFVNTLFSYASADQTTLDALAAAAKPTGFPSKYTATLRVTATETRLVVAPTGTLVRLQ